MSIAPGHPGPDLERPCNAVGFHDARFEAMPKVVLSVRFLCDWPRESTFSGVKNIPSRVRPDTELRNERPREHGVGATRVLGRG
jgi:hypothetical protein